MASIRKVVETRYTLLPYLYTLFYNVNTHGGTVVRSLVHEFSRDKITHDVVIKRKLKLLNSVNYLNFFNLRMNNSYGVVHY